MYQNSAWLAIGVLIAGLGLSGCDASNVGSSSSASSNAGNVPSNADSAEMLDDQETEIKQKADKVFVHCPVLESSNWRAWIEASSDDAEKRVLHVAGELKLPTPRYTIEWQVGPADKMMPPGQYLELVLTPPNGIVAQVIATEQVHYQGDAIYPDYRVIYVRCGDTMLAEIGDVETLQ